MTTMKIYAVGGTFERDVRELPDGRQQSLLRTYAGLTFCKDGFEKEITHLLEKSNPNDRLLDMQITEIGKWWFLKRFVLSLFGTCDF
jgi:hypothetical protein